MKKSKFSEVQIVRILQEAAPGSKTVAEICRENGVSQNTYTVWRRKVAGTETEDLRKRRDLVLENDAFKRLLPDRELEISALKTVFRKHGRELPSELRERG